VTGVDPTLPSPSALRLLRWNAGASGVENVSAAEIGTTLATSNWVVDEFVDGVDYTAGSTTALTLSQSPSLIQNTWVFFDGVVQHQSTYSIAGDIITFDSAIPGGTGLVEVRQNEALDQGSTAASAVSFTPEGTDSVDTTSDKKHDEVRSVQDFGAVADNGAVNDTAAFVAASNAVADGGEILVPPGNYVVTISTLRAANSKTHFWRALGATINGNEGQPTGWPGFWHGTIGQGDTNRYRTILADTDPRDAAVTDYHSTLMIVKKVSAGVDFTSVAVPLRVAVITDANSGDVGGTGAGIWAINVEGEQNSDVIEMVF
jgi:hypothetical protein